MLCFKMADGSVHVLNDVLCFVNCKYGRLPAKQLKSVLIDFYDEEAISKAKVCLLNDIMKINSSVKHPHIPQRRDGDNRLTREIDDIVMLFCFVDENNLTSNLPRYVSSNPDNMPSSRIYEGDLRSIMGVLDKMSDKIGELGRALSAISHDVNTLQRAVGGQSSYSSYTSEPATACAINRSVGQRDHQQVQPRSTHMGNYAENATTVSVDTADTVGRSVQQSDSSNTSRKWATLSSTPLPSSNRFNALASTTDDDEHGDEQGDSFTLVQRRRNKRQRDGATPPQQSVQRQLQQPLSAQTVQRRRPLLFGKASGSTGISAARIMRKKAVFYIDNVNSKCSVNDIQTLVKNMKVNVISCFEVKPRRYRTHNSTDSKAFRLCINDEDKQRMLDASMWPDSIVISEWFFKQPTVTAGHKQQRSGESVSTREQPLHPIDPTGAAAAAAATDAAADDVTVDMTSDDTILAACNMDTASSSNDGV